MKPCSFIILLCCIGCGCATKRQTLKLTMPPVPKTSVAQSQAVSPPAKTITLAWDNPPQDYAGVVLELWSSTDLNYWSLSYEIDATLGKGVVPLRYPDCEFFKARYRTPYGTYSDWSMK